MATRDPAAPGLGRTPPARPAATPIDPADGGVRVATVDAAPDPALARAARWARLLDRHLVDPVLGLVLPGAGDLLGAALGAYTVVLALRRRVGLAVIARMLLNLAIDALLGVVPVVGDLFDLGFRANQRNVALLAARTAGGGRATARDRLIVAAAALAFVGAIALAAYVLVAALRTVAGWM